MGARQAESLGNKPAPLAQAALSRLSAGWQPETEGRWQHNWDPHSQFASLFRPLTAMPAIEPLQFQRIVAAHGQIEGAVYFDAEEELTHELFPDCIVFQTNFLDSSSYEVAFAESELRVRKTRLDNYQRGHKAQVIDDAMDNDDWEELGNLWQRLSRDLDSQGQQAQPDPSDALADLFYYLFDEAQAETLVQNLYYLH